MSQLPRLLRPQKVPRQIWIYLGLAAAGVAILVAILLPTAISLSREPDFRHFLLRTDFPAFITGAQLIAGGHGADLYNPEAQKPVQAAILAPYVFARGLLPYNHLPFLAVALSPFAGLPLPVSYGLWLGATLLALVGGLALLCQELQAAARTPIEARWAPRALVALTLGFFPVYQTLLQVQTAPWDLLGYTLMIRYLRQERDVAAGLALGLVLLKPQLLIVPLLVLLYTRRWRVLATFAGLAGGLALLVTPLLGGLGWLPRYLSLLLRVAQVTADSSTIQPPLMENLRGFFTLLAAKYDPDPAIRGTGNAGWVLPLTALGSLIVLALLARAWQGAPQWRTAPARWDAGWAAALVATLLVNPHGLPYELTLLPLPAVLAWRAARESGQPAAVARTAWLLAAGYIAGTLTVPLLIFFAWPFHVAVLFMLVAVPLLCGIPRTQAGVQSPESKVPRGDR